jgi:hypothetical protein
MENKLNTSAHFQSESDFDLHYLNKMYDNREINRERVINEAWQVKNGEKNKAVKALKYKISSAIFSGNYKNINEDFIIDKIIEGDEVYQHMFMVDPKKQNGGSTGTEFIQTNYIQNKFSSYDGVNILRLNNHGKESFRIVGDKIVKGANRSANSTKSLDCIITNTKGKTIFTINKVTTSLIATTNDGGGAQDNQLHLSEKDVDKIDFTKVENKDIYIIFILDGKYYKNNLYVLELIEKYQDNKNIYLTTSDGIKEVIGTILHD